MFPPYRHSTNYTFFVAGAIRGLSDPSPLRLPFAKSAQVSVDRTYSPTRICAMRRLDFTPDSLRWVCSYYEATGYDSGSSYAV